MNFRLSPGETAYALDDSRPAAHVFDATLAGATREALEIARHTPALLVAVGGDQTECAVSFGKILGAGASLPTDLPDTEADRRRPGRVDAPVHVGDYRNAALTAENTVSSS